MDQQKWYNFVDLKNSTDAVKPAEFRCYCNSPRLTYRVGVVVVDYVPVVRPVLPPANIFGRS